MITPKFSTFILVRYLETSQDNILRPYDWAPGLVKCNKLIEQCMTSIDPEYSLSPLMARE